MGKGKRVKQERGPLHGLGFGFHDQGRLSADHPVEVASEGDRVWFEQHPNAKRRVRPEVPGELPGPTIPGSMVIVTQIAPGCRARVRDCDWPDPRIDHAIETARRMGVS